MVNPMLEAPFYAVSSFGRKDDHLEDELWIKLPMTACLQASVTAMDQLLKVFRTWGAPTSGLLFMGLWWMAESSRVPENVLEWDGFWPLIVIGTAICVAAWSAPISLGLSGSLLLAQLTHLIPTIGATTWPMFIGVFATLTFVLWTESKRMRVIALCVVTAFAPLMAVLMVSRAYGSGVGWFLVQGVPAQTMWAMWLQCLTVLTFIGAGFVAAGGLLALYEGRRRLLIEKNGAERSLHSAEVELALEQERSRIAHDLHDVLAHSLAVIVAQADGCRYSRPDLPVETTRALETIADAGRRAMRDAQQVISASRENASTSPSPRLDDLALLTEQSGLKVHRIDAGTPCFLGELQEIAVYRIVQESLTNALKHARASTAILALNWTDEGLRLFVSSPLSTQGAATEHGSGRGIPGMKARATLAGGTLSTHRAGNTFVVDAFVPSLPSRENLIGHLAGSREVEKSGMAGVHE